MPYLVQAFIVLGAFMLGVLVLALIQDFLGFVLRPVTDLIERLVDRIMGV